MSISLFDSSSSKHTSEGCSKSGFTWNFIQIPTYYTCFIKIPPFISKIRS